MRSAAAGYSGHGALSARLSHAEKHIQELRLLVLHLASYLSWRDDDDDARSARRADLAEQARR